MFEVDQNINAMITLLAIVTNSIRNESHDWKKTGEEEISFSYIALSSFFENLAFSAA
jgi:hypothetical protein